MNSGLTGNALSPNIYSILIYTRTVQCIRVYIFILFYLSLSLSFADPMKSSVSGSQSNFFFYSTVFTRTLYTLYSLFQSNIIRYGMVLLIGRIT